MPEKLKILIEEFGGDQALADEIAKLHLKIRFEQREDGTNDFKPEVTDIYDSQSDLHNMQRYYIKSGGNFWIARDKVSGKIVGFVGLKKDSSDTCVLKRMAVLKEYRRHGIGTELTKTLVSWAKENGFKQITLGTGVTEKAHELYLQQGFVDTGFGKDGADYQMRLNLS